MTPHQEAIDLWCVAYEKKFGRKYTFLPADARAVKTLLNAGQTPQQILELATAAWNAPVNGRFWNCSNMSHSLFKFAGRINDIQAELAAVKKPVIQKGF